MADDSSETPVVDEGGAPARRYIVSVKGSAEANGEISVVDEGNAHGRGSYGWFDNDLKILIASSGGPRDDAFLPCIWEAHIALAHKIADDLNNGNLRLSEKEK